MSARFAIGRSVAGATGGLMYIIGVDTGSKTLIDLGILFLFVLAAIACWEN